MKKLFSLLTMLCMALFIAGCTGDDATTPTADPAPAPGDSTPGHDHDAAGDDAAGEADAGDAAEPAGDATEPEAGSDTE